VSLQAASETPACSIAVRTGAGHDEEQEPLGNMRQTPNRSVGLSACFLQIAQQDLPERCDAKDDHLPAARSRCLNEPEAHRCRKDRLGLCSADVTDAFHYRSLRAFRSFL
jgi:hypothetical protein